MFFRILLPFLHYLLLFFEIVYFSEWGEWGGSSVRIQKTDFTQPPRTPLNLKIEMKLSFAVANKVSALKKNKGKNPGELLFVLRPPVKNDVTRHLGPAPITKETKTSFLARSQQTHNIRSKRWSTTRSEASQTLLIAFATPFSFLL